MFNKEKEKNSELMSCPWNQNNGYVVDYTFATRLFSFLLRNYKSMSTAHLIDEEEFEYLIKSAAKLKRWQMSVPTSLNNQYFSNMKGQKVEGDKIKYLNAIGCPNVMNIEEYLDPEVKEKNETVSIYDSIWIAVGTDGKYRAFIGSPTRNKKKEYVTDENEWEEDYHGHFFHPDKWTGNWLHYWEGRPSSLVVNEGTIVDPNDLPASFQNMSWESEPKKLMQK